ncbi:MAG TPA: Rne/Rng family ribonuclease [Paracoccaceae bacterium]|nr:Rne/Rng family ribonuclease [Paracoccaceae bacterium]
MLIDATHPEETRVVVLDGQKIEDFDFESTSKRQIAGNIYLAKVTRVEPSLQAAFVEYGGNRHGFLAFSEIHPDYYQIPKADREALMAEEEAEARRYAEAAEARRNAESEDRAEDSGEEEDERDDGARDPRGSEDDDEGEGDDRGEDGDDDGGRPREMAESAGAEDDERVQEDWPGETAEAEGETPRRRRTRRRPAAGAATAPDEAAKPAEAPAEPTEPAAADETAEPVAAASETPNEAETVTETTAPEPSAAETDVPAPEAPSGEAAPKVSEAAPAAPEAEGETSVEVEDGEDERGAEAGDEEGDGRRRRRSRRGGRARGRRRGKREDGEDDVKPSAEADAPESRPAEAEETELPAPPDAVERDAGDFMAEAISARRIAQRRYKIQEVIKVRQILLVQVVKEERGNKGAALTTYLSLAGRYCVLMPNTARGGGISRKITNAADRKKLKEIAGELEVPKGMGLIVRTAGANRTKPEIKRDYEYLLRQWERIRETTLSSVAPTLIYEEGSLVKRVIRDLYTGDIDEILVEGEEGYREAKDYMGMLMPSHARHVKPWREQTPLYARFGVEQELDSLFNPTVQLKSGGYIVIGVTEALVAIDINSGKSTKEGSIEDTALKTNLEAADEIARQLKLRDLAGLIVIDFIDMDEGRNNRAVEKRMKDRLKDDRARIQMGRISSFGLMEMSRQRLRPGMIEATTAPCGHCHGTGVVRSDGSLALAALRRLQSEAAKNRAPELLARLPLGAASFLFNEKREHIAEIEGRFGVSVRIEADAAMVSPQFEVDRVKTQTRKPAAAPAVSPVAWTEPEPEPVEEAEVAAEAPPAPAPAPAPAAEAPAEAPAPAPTPAEDEEEAGRRRRGRRGGRRRRRDDAGAEGMDVIEAAHTGDPRAAAEAKPEPAKAEAEAGAEIAASEAEAAAEIPAPKRTRRRRKPKEAETQEAAEAALAAPDEAPAAPESAAPSEPAEPPAAAEAAPEPAAAAGSTPSVPAETTEAAPAEGEPLPAPKPDEPVPALPETAVPAETPSAPEAAALPAEPEDQPPPPPSVETPESERLPAPAAETGETAPVEAEAEETDASPKPKRRGWWSLGG